MIHSLRRLTKSGHPKLTNIGSSNMVHRLRSQVTEDSRLARWHKDLHTALNVVAKKAATYQNKQCLDFTCGAKPVDSHVIPEAFLRNLAASGELVSPHLENGSDGCFEPVSGKTRPTFNGYCEEHEKKLFPWENGGTPFEPFAAESQLMRVADATWYEYRVRANILEWASAEIAPERVSSWAKPPTFQDAKVLNEKHEAWQASGVELRAAVEDFDVLRTSLRRSLGLLPDAGQRAAVGQLTIPSGAGRLLHLADGAWIPDWVPVDGANMKPAPFVISVLHDSHGTHLSFASTNAAQSVIWRMDNVFSRHHDAAISFVLHWMRHGNFYWYMNQVQWMALDEQLRDVFKNELERGPYVSAALYSDGGIDKHPILRFGNGWG